MKQQVWRFRFTDGEGKRWYITESREVVDVPMKGFPGYSLPVPEPLWLTLSRAFIRCVEVGMRGASPEQATKTRLRSKE